MFVGPSSPLALASIAPRERVASRLVGGVYAANTAGTIAGALVSSLLLIQWVGTQHTQHMLIGSDALKSELQYAMNRKKLISK